MAKAKTAVTKLPQTYQTLLDRAITTLRAIQANTGIDFLVVSEKHGIREGTGALIKQHTHEQRRQRAKPKQPHGTLTRYYLPLMRDLQPDEIVVIPCSGFDVNSLQSSVAARANQLWGNRSYTCVLGTDRKSVELWRLPEGLDKSALMSPKQQITRSE